MTIFARLEQPIGTGPTIFRMNTQYKTASNSLHPSRVIPGFQRVMGIGGFFDPMKTTKTYSEKLKDPRWQRKRLEILARDNFECRHCHSKEKSLHVHHKLYRKGANPWEYEADLLLTLCEDCHKEAEQTRIQILRFLGTSTLCDEFLIQLIKAFSGNNQMSVRRTFFAIMATWEQIDSIQDARSTTKRKMHQEEAQDQLRFALAVINETLNKATQAPTA